MSFFSLVLFDACCVICDGGLSHASARLSNDDRIWGKTKVASECCTPAHRDLKEAEGVAFSA